MESMSTIHGWIVRYLGICEDQLYRSHWIFHSSASMRTCRGIRGGETVFILKERAAKIGLVNLVEKFQRDVSYLAKL